MKPVILDTNALAMVLTEDARLPKRAKHVILNAPLASVSAISFYEIGQKVRLGKWDAMVPFAKQLVEIVAADGFNLIALNPHQAIQAALLDWTHRDPFDRMLAAVAIREETLLVSSDAAFDELGKIDRVCCNQVEMSVVPQSRNVPLGLAEAWLGRAETSDIAALNSHAGVVIPRRVMRQPRLVSLHV